MKKILSLILALAMVLALCSCGQSAKGGKDDKADRNVDASAEASIPEEEDDNDIEGDRPVVDAPQVEEPLEIQMDGPANLTVETKEGTVAADDGTVVMTYSYQVPTIEVPNDVDVTEAIQADLNQIVSDFEASMEASAEEAKSVYADPGLPSDASYMYNYAQELYFSVQRCDERVMSIVVQEYAYTGGAHGMTGETGISYDMMTGRRITFEDLGGEAFKAACVEKVTALADAQNEEEPDMFFDDYQSYVPNIVQDGTATYQEVYGFDDVEGNVESTYFLGKDGVTFIDGEYVMQPYAAGILYFTVPYEELADIIPETYMPM